jgi:hypothetical protein
MSGQSVVSSYYRYWTVKIKIDAPFDYSNGWVSRFVWEKDKLNSYSPESGVADKE